MLTFLFTLIPSALDEVKRKLASTKKTVTDKDFDAAN